MAPAALARDFLAALEFGPADVQLQVAAETITGALVSLDFERGLQISACDGRKRWIPLEHIRSVTQAGTGRG